MPPFLSYEGREFFHLPLLEPAAYELPFPRQPYPCVIWDHQGGWSDTQRDLLAASLLETDCRYAVCGGVDCKQWHDTIDLRFIRTIPEAEADARFVMTTWDTDEPPLEVAWFFAWNTNFDDHDFTRFLILELGHPTTPGAAAVHCLKLTHGDASA